MKSNDPVNEHNMDELLNSYMLNEFSEEKDIALAQLVMDKEYDVAPDKKHEEDLIKKLGGKTGGRGGIVGMIIMLVLITVSLLLFIHYNTEESESEITTRQTIDQPEQEWSTPSELKPLSIPNDSSIERLYKDITPQQVDSSSADTSLAVHETNVNVPIFNSRVKEEDPLFTRSEKFYYQRLKKSMIESIINVDTSIYTHVEEKLINYKKDKMGVNAFTVRNFSVTNMEYKAFLVDMLSKSNQKTLLRIMVDDNVWNDYHCGKLAKDYFDKSEYDGFPVVNISPEATLLFCKWLEKEVNIYLLAKDAKAKPVKIRLPYDYEWISASKIGIAQVPKCDGYQTIYDSSEGLVSKSFLKRIDKIQQRDAQNKKKFDDFFGINRYGMSEEEILKIFGNSLPNNSTSENYPVGLGDIGKLAHVSEFIKNPSEEIIVFGSCWESKLSYAKMLGEFKKNEASPFIGFRFVIEDEHSDTYKNPFW